MRLILLCALGLGIGCGGDDHLSVRGDVSVEAPDGTPTGFVFTQNTRLVDEDFARPDTELIAGRCRIGSDEEGNEIISLAISRPNAIAEGAQLRRVHLRLPRESVGGTIEADLGGEIHRGNVGAAGCIADLQYVERGDGLVGVSFDCALAGSGGNAQAVGELFYEGCSPEAD